MEEKEANYVRLLNDECERMYYGVCSTELTEDCEFVICYPYYGLESEQLSFFSVEHLLKVVLKELLKEVEEALIEKQENIDKIALQTQLGDLYKVLNQGVEEPLKLFKVYVSTTLYVVFMYHF